MKKRKMTIEIDDNVLMYGTDALNADNYFKYLTRCVKRDTPIRVGIDDIFTYDDPHMGYNLIDKQEFKDYYDNLISNVKWNLEMLFVAMSLDVSIKYKIVKQGVIIGNDEVEQKLIRLRFNNQLDDCDISIDLTHAHWLENLICSHINMEYFIDVF